MTAERHVTILNRKGLHVRPAAAFAKEASRFKSKIRILRDGRSFDGKSSLDLLMIAAVPGTRLIIQAEGEDAEEAASELARFVDGKFGMEDAD
ncbi:MAG TPA: HPr family phosphocarrier protein [Planctomycetota bacterium]|nr:HPr family phosphocarrier protein [Planctomycetota bacterium]